MSTLNSESTVAQWVTERPQTADIFEELKVDYCCGGAVPLSEACQARQLNTSTVLSRLDEAGSRGDPEQLENWQDSRLGELCDHIEATHHAYLRSVLPRLTERIDKVVNAHGASHPELRELQQAFSALRAELEPHMMKEEQILFPAIRQLEEASMRPQFPFGEVANPIRMMEHEHEVAGKALAQIRALTNDFQPPDDACNTYRLMLDSLQTLERDLHQHIHKENNILFPRSQQLEAKSHPPEV